MRRTHVLLTVLWTACGAPATGTTAESSEGPGSSSGSSGGSSGEPTTAAASDSSSGASGPTTEGPGSSSTGEPPTPNPYPDPGAFEPNEGPGGPAVAFDDMALGVECAALDGGMDGDLGNDEIHDTEEHHNLLLMFNGYLLMPWAPEFGTNAGVTFYDFSDPCKPTAVGSRKSDEMRESHSIGLSNVNGRWYMVVDQLRLLDFAGGVEFWDVTDPTKMGPVSKVEVPGFFYPDAYAKVTLSVFWQGDYVYVGGADNGVFVIDASDPLSPTLVHQYKFDPVLRVGQVQVVGNLLMATAAEGVRVALMDVSKPDFLQPIPGGEFDVTREAYFSNMGGGYGYFVPKEGGGGLIIYDIRDPSAPTFISDFVSPGNGGYVFTKDDLAFVGESDFATIYDISDPAAITKVREMTLTGDLDTITPIGNVAVLSVDDKADPDRGSIVIPYAKEVDATPPHVTWVYPPDGATDLPVTSRIGLTFNEFVDVKSAWAGSVRLYETGTDPALTRVEGKVNAQELIVNFSPDEPLKPGTEYTLEVPAGGIRDYNDNAIEEAFTMTFRTAGG